MSDDQLSQDEIDALLKVGSDDDEAELTNSELLSPVEIDTLGEIGNISFGSSATTMSTLLNQKVEITTPDVSIITKEELADAFESEQVQVNVNYSEGFDGQNILLMNSEDVAVIADIMLGGDGTSPEQELSEIKLSAVQEVMNQMMGTAATSMSSVFNKKIDISPPTIQVEKDGDSQSSETAPGEDHLVKVSFRLKVGELIDSNIMQLIPLFFARQLVNQLMASSADKTEADEEPAEAETAAAAADHSAAETAPEQPETADQEPHYLGNKVGQESASVQKAAFSELEQTDFSQTEKQNLDMLLDISLDVAVELGRTNRTIQDILQLAAGSVIELNKLAGEPVDIKINDKLIAKGEVVVIDENFGVRVTDIMSRTDRLKTLK
ncbi:flagellar motor switch phosphatase FliY [Barrientosiimonas marina]|uniref:Flagellar motor switch phosphatase FliY n=1 Tax=Lentibacillus kimchii TaxID=1542911 RepID=A0ABW2UT21_9BACI